MMNAIIVVRKVIGQQIVRILNKIEEKTSKKVGALGVEIKVIKH